MGRHDEALAEIGRAQELDPLSLIISTDVGKVHYIARQYDPAIEQYKKTLEMDPDYEAARLWLGLAYAAKGQYEEAIGEFHQVKGLADEPLSLSCLGYVYGRAGRRDEAREILKRLTALPSQTYIPPIGMVIIHAGLGERDEAFKWLDKNFEERGIGVVGLKVDPGYDTPRPDPRFTDFLRRAGFTP